MPTTQRRRSCIVLNNQMAVHIDESAARTASALAARFVFQADPSRRMSAVRIALSESSGTLPVFFVIGRRSEDIVAEGILREVRFSEELSQHDRRTLRADISKSDRSLYGRSFLVVTDVMRRDGERYAPIPMSAFRKASDGLPIRPGSWIASVCRLPTKRVLKKRISSDPAEDESFDGLEGQERTHMVRHRRREKALRDAKIRTLLHAGKLLRCEVKGCGFAFERTYGALGALYAHVHHLLPLGERASPSATPLSELAIVCANCHAMIHRHGDCLSLAEIARAIRTSTGR
jgi:hypothetical protein